MASTIKIKRSSVAGKQPTTSDIAAGELALNIKDQKLYSSNGSAVFQIGGGAANGAVTITTATVKDLTQNDTVVTNVSSYANSVVDNSLLATKASWDALTSTNTALRTLISDRLQVANAAATYQTKAVERAALANTNSAISNLNTNLTGTNTAIRTLVSTESSRVDLVNSNLTSTNTALRTLISDRLQVANASSTYQTKAVERAALANTNSYIASVQSDVDSNEATERAALANTNSYIATKANIASPTFTGVPAAPTAAAATNTTQIATTAFVRTEISNLVDSAPSTLDTLNELAAALGDDPNFATTIASTYQTKSVERAALANTNSAISNLNTNLTSTNTAIRGLVSTQTSRIDLVNSNLTSTNTAIRGLVSTESSRVDLINTNLTSTNTALRTLISDRLQVANASATYQTKAVERAALANTNAYIATKLASSSYTAADVLTKIKTVDGAGSGLDADLLDGQSSAYFAVAATENSRLANTNAYIATKVNTSNPTITGTLSANGSVGTAGYVLKSAGVGNPAYWDAESGGGGGGVSVATFNSALANTNTYIATKLDSSSYTASDVLTKIQTVDGAGSGLDADTLDGVEGESFLRSDAADSFSGKLTWSGGAADAILINSGGHIVLTNGNIRGVNQLQINDPGEGILFKGTNNVELLAIDDANDNIMNFSGAAELRRNDNKVWDAGNDGSGSGLDADTLDGVEGASYLRSDASDSFTSGTLTVGGTALDVNVNMTAAGNITMDGSSKLLTLNNNSLDEFTEYARPLANSGTAITLDVSDNTQLYTLTGNCTFTLPALSNYPANSSKSITIVVKQDGTGGRTVAFSATDGYSINNSASVPAPSSGASKVSIYTCIGIVELAEWFISLSYIDD